ncbi:hypothetical protein EJ05DRAFT_496313 [Pseudovirgaria hyperparasitica]|uniref:C2H2-type domain-containing protein n=1 Tax=Pseudovirgaria hyperparasitica TaxID=470096 RepID=A0A6A6WMQ7_9PEZI|nr:uncharacterized protein EJ05DRAFT_496313 [Pseudovirgaria hyperparasitica]KAF2763494.1 hypothetical protein EJ05DRAFT_496313 [Pseudovirgaria hyperparasitica]
MNLDLGGGHFSDSNVKKTFIVATLVSTLIGTFTSSHNLYERLGEKRKQHKKDEQQNDAIKELKDEIKDLKKGGKNDARRDDSPRADNLVSSLDQSGQMIQREFNNGFARLGDRFAGGDLVTENALQKQIIQLQQTVINVLQDAVNSGRQLSQRDIDKLAMASDMARDNTLEALRSQYQRQAGQDDRRISLAPAASERLRITSGLEDLSLAPPKRPNPANSLFCPYAMDLQDMPRRALAGAFDAGRGDGCCPDCHIRVSVNSQDRWKIRKRLPVLVSRNGRQEEIIEEHVFEIGPRLVVKCHTESGGFACLLCHKTRDFDALCKDPEVLVSHIGKAHNMEEYSSEVDIVEM